MRRLPLRIQKTFDQYEIKTGSAGFILLFKNGKRIQPKNMVIKFNRKKEASKQ